MAKKESSSHSRMPIKQMSKHENAIIALVLIVLVAVWAAISKGFTASWGNALNILVESSIRGIASVGQAFVILSAGIDLSVGGIGLTASVLGASIMTGNPEWSIVAHPVSMYAAIPVMLLVASAFGTINGAFVSRLGLPPLLVTFGIWQICQGVSFQISKGLSIANLPKGMDFIGQGSIGGLPIPIIAFISVSVVAYFVLNHTTFGKSLYACGGNPTTAWLSGVRISNVRLAVYVIAGFLAGVAGIVWTARTMSATMRSLMNLELDTIAAVSIGGVSLSGGKGGVIGVILGVIIVGVIKNGMSFVGAGPFIQNFVQGWIIIAAVAVDYYRRR